MKSIRVVRDGQSVGWMKNNGLYGYVTTCVKSYATQFESKEEAWVAVAEEKRLYPNYWGNSNFAIDDVEPKRKCVVRLSSKFNNSGFIYLSGRSWYGGILVKKERADAFEFASKEDAEAAVEKDKKASPIWYSGRTIEFVETISALETVEAFKAQIMNDYVIGCDPCKVDEIGQVVQLYVIKKKADYVVEWYKEPNKGTTKKESEAHKYTYEDAMRLAENSSGRYEAVKYSPITEAEGVADELWRDALNRTNADLIERNKELQATIKNILSANRSTEFDRLALIHRRGQLVRDINVKDAMIEELKIWLSDKDISINRLRGEIESLTTESEELLKRNARQAKSIGMLIDALKVAVNNWVQIGRHSRSLEAHKDMLKAELISDSFIDIKDC